MIEKRRAVRFPYRLKVEIKTEKKRVVLYSDNITINGILLSSELDIEKLKKIGIDIEKEILLSFYLLNQSQEVKVFGTVVRMARNMDPGYDMEESLIGIQFKNLPDETKKHLEDRIFRN